MKTGIHLKQIIGAVGLLICLIAFFSCGGGGGPSIDIPPGAELTEGMKILVRPGGNREFSYTNKQSAFYYGYTNGYNDLYFQGLTSYRQKLFDDYSLLVDGRPASREKAETTVFFHQLVRDYGDLNERVTLLDDRSVLLVEIECDKNLTVVPLFPDGELSYETEWDGERAVLFVTTEGWRALPDEPGMPRWLGVSLGPSAGHADKAPRAVPGGKRTVGSLSVSSQEGAILVFAADHDRETVARLSDDTLTDPHSYVTLKKERLEELLLRTYVQTDSDSLNQALSWAKISMDALVMNQDKRGIFAGLPWFNDYWGRDTFISLPGALLVTGQFKQARQILKDFGTYQLTDTVDPLYGRIPNRIRPDEVIYNTADGTPWFVREIYEYTLYSGDTTFARLMFRVVKRSIEGTIKYRTDGFGFLTHDDADTWMDAKIEGTIPWSPRGDRACDIQALWYTQLVAGARLASLARDTRSEERWLRHAARLRRAFDSYFLPRDEIGIYDHLNDNFLPDHNTRPNQIFCLTVPFTHPFPDTSRYVSLNGPLGDVDLDLFTERLVYPFGVGSLWKNNLHFHPYHHHSNYHYDASYHNGIVWTWNSGPVVTAYCRDGRTVVPRTLFDALTNQILNRGAVGTIAELIDAAPKNKKGDPELSGTFTQAWSLAEYLRNFYQDFLGVYPLFDKYGLSFTPSAVLDLYGSVRFVVQTKHGQLHCAYDLDRKKIRITAPELSEQVPVVLDGTEYLLASGSIIVHSLPEMTREKEETVSLAGTDVPVNTQSMRVKNYLETRLRKIWE